MGANHLSVAGSFLPSLLQRHTTDPTNQPACPGRRRRSASRGGFSAGWVQGPLLLLAALSACREQTGRPPAEGHLDVSWSGKERGSVSGAATARWCGLRQVLEIQSVQGDTGVAVALYPGQSPKPGTYRVVDPATADSLPPAAAVAVRWLGQTVVQGFQGESGRMMLQRSNAGLFSGSFSARARSVVDTQHLNLTGTFRDLSLRRDTLGCAPRDEDADMGDDADMGNDAEPEDAETIDTGVH
jgi:hypothetical protein